MAAASRSIKEDSLARVSAGCLVSEHYRLWVSTFGSLPASPLCQRTSSLQPAKHCFQPAQKPNRHPHLVQLLVDLVQVLKVCYELPHDGAISQGEDLRVLGARGSAERGNRRVV